MLRCASSFVIAAYATVRLIPHDSRALPADFLRSRPLFGTFKTFYEVVIIEFFRIRPRLQGIRGVFLWRQGTPPGGAPQAFTAGYMPATASTGLNERLSRIRRYGFSPSSLPRSFSRR